MDTVTNICHYYNGSFIPMCWNTVHSKSKSDCNCNYIPKSVSRPKPENVKLKIL